MGNTGSQIYSDSAGAGQIFSGFGLIVSAIIGIIMIIAGIIFLFKRSVYSSSVQGIVNTANCTQVLVNNNTQYQCSITFGYTVGGKQYGGSGTITSGVLYQQGSFITIYYDSNNPASWSFTSDNYKVLGAILIAIALFMIGISYFWYWASRKNKFIASTVGASGALGLLSGGRIGGIV